MLKIKKTRTRVRATWRNMIILAALILVAAVGYYVYLLKHIQDTASRAVANLPPINPARLDEKKLTEVLKFLDDKEASFSRLLAEPPVIIDPAR